MKHYHICIECGNPTPEESTNMVYTDVMSGVNKQIYCMECFKSITKDTIAKNKKKNGKK